MKKKRTGRVGSFGLKLNMSKAYDHVEWSFIEVMLLKMGFSVNWISRIMHFVSSFGYLIVVC